jgi:hypothetical protein
MYRRPKFLEILLEIRREMALEADYDIDLFVECARKGQTPINGEAFSGSQNNYDSSEINAEILPVSKSRREIRKG